MHKYQVFLLKLSKLRVTCSLSLSFWKIPAEFSAMTLSSVLISAVDQFEGFQLWQGNDNNLDTKNSPLFQNLKLLFILIC